MADRIMASLETIAKGEAISQASKMIFGFQPNIIYTDTQALVRFTLEQNKFISNYLNTMMMDPNPPDIDIDFNALVGPWVLKTALPYFLGAILAGGAAGYMIKR
jgi:hypothetical protein